MYTPLTAYIANKFYATEQDPWGVRAEHLKGFLPDAPSYMPHTAIEWLLDRPDYYKTELGVVCDHKMVDTGQFTTREELESYLHEQQASLAFAGLQRYDSRLNNLCMEIEEQSRLGTFVAAFHTPAAQQTLDIHWDKGTVVAIQLSGRKRWWLWQPFVRTIKEISSLRPITLEEKSAQPFLSVVLEPGDALFVPRGWPHCAVNEGDEPSFHISFGALHSDIRHHKFAGYTRNY